MPADPPVSPNRIAALVIGGLFVALGALGLIATSVRAFFDPTGFWLFGILGMNSAQNVLHLALGIALLAFVFSPWTARVNAIIGTVLLAIGIAGLFIISTPANLIAVNGAANLLHFATSACLLVVGLGARR